MDKKQFTAMVVKPESFTSQDRGWLRAMQAKYPQSALVGLLALLADHAYGFDTADERRAVELLGCEGLDTTALLSKAHQAADDTSFDILSEINTYQEVSFKTAPKSVILSNFLQIASDGEAPDDYFDPQQPTSSAESELPEAQPFATETLAIILEKQGKYDQALAIYKNLLVANPEKSSTFAPRIEQLQTLIKNK